MRLLRPDLSRAALLAILAFVAAGCSTLSEVLEPSTTVSSVPVPEAPASPLPLAQGVSAERDAAVDLGSDVGPSSPATEAPASSVTGPLDVSALAEVSTREGEATHGVAESAPSMIESAGESPAAQVRDNSLDVIPEDYDPWEPYNERMFAFNYNVDRYVLKPAANVYRHVIPEPFQLMISNGFDNLRFPPRFVNLVLQGRFWGAFVETSRFVINSVMGIGGLFNPATDYFGIPKARADFGQTMAKWGVGAGPFFVPPFLPPATVRDFVGRMADSAVNPVAWFLLGFWPEGVAIGAGEMLNERAVNYEAFQGVEETTLDLYTAVRDGYLRRRERQLQQPAE